MITRNDVVKFKYNNTTVTGFAVIIDKYGTFMKPDVPSCDILVPEFGLFKHIPCDEVTFIRNATLEDLEQIRKFGF